MTAELSDQELFDAARPEGWQRATRSIGCPVILALSGLVAQVAYGVGSGIWGPLGWIAAVAAFLLAGPILMGVVSMASSGGKGELEEALRQRVGQGDFSVAVRALEAEAEELAADQQGRLLLVRAARSDGTLSIEVRLDVRTDGEAPVAQVTAKRGPSLNLYSRDFTSLEAWERIEQELDDPEAWLAVLSALDQASVARSRGVWSLQAAAMTVGPDSAVERSRARVDLDSPTGSVLAWDAARSLLKRLDWLPDEEQA